MLKFFSYHLFFFLAFLHIWFNLIFSFSVKPQELSHLEVKYCCKSGLSHCSNQTVEPLGFWSCIWILSFFGHSKHNNERKEKCTSLGSESSCQNFTLGTQWADAISSTCGWLQTEQNRTWRCRAWGHSSTSIMTLAFLCVSFVKWFQLTHVRKEKHFQTSHNCLFGCCWLVLPEAHALETYSLESLGWEGTGLLRRGD